LKSSWARPELDSSIFDKPIIFQQLEADYTIGQQKKGYPGPTSGSVPIIRLYGVTQEGHSVMCHLRGFTPYFYVPVPSDYDMTRVNEIKKYLTVFFKIF